METIIFPRSQDTPALRRNLECAYVARSMEQIDSSASLKVTGVVRIYGVVIGSGRPGPVANLLRCLFRERAEISPLWASGV